MRAIHTLNSNNKTWKAFILFLIWPVLSIGFSITLYLFALIYNREVNRKVIRTGYKRAYARPFYLLGFSFIISATLTPTEIDVAFGFTILSIVQHLYWIMVGVFLIKNYPKIVLDDLMKTIFYGVLILIITFFFLQYTPFRNTPVFSLRISRNSFVFTMLIFLPFFLIYVRKRWGSAIFNLSSILLIFLFLLTEGRAGFLLSTVEVFLIKTIYNKKFIKVWIVAFSFLLMSLALLPLSLTDLRVSLGGAVSPFSERVGNFIEGEAHTSGDLSHDKSWLTRQLMIEKGFEIIRKYPFFGIGPLNFTNYRANLSKFSYDVEFSRLSDRLHSDSSSLNTTSPHNAYLQTVTEYGIIGFSIIIFILMRSCLYVLSKIWRGNLSEADAPHISVLIISIHFFVISSFTGTLTFVILGLSQGALAWKNSSIKLR